MRTRAVFFSDDHVQALNTIDVVFAGEKNIRALWKKCLDHLITDETQIGWTDTLTTLRVDLYQAIGDEVGYHYTTDYLKSGIYFPIRHQKTMDAQTAVLEGFAKAVGDGVLKVTAVAHPAPAPPLRPGVALPVRDDTPMR
jgi:hypothetical protein